MVVAPVGVGVVCRGAEAKEGGGGEGQDIQRLEKLEMHRIASLLNFKLVRQLYAGC